MGALQTALGQALIQAGATLGATTMGLWALTAWAQDGRRPSGPVAAGRLAHLKAHDVAMAAGPRLQARHRLRTIVAQATADAGDAPMGARAFKASLEALLMGQRLIMGALEAHPCPTQGLARLRAVRAAITALEVA